MKGRGGGEGGQLQRGPWCPAVAEGSVLGAVLPETHCRGEKNNMEQKLVKIHPHSSTSLPHTFHETTLVLHELQLSVFYCSY